MFSPDKPIILSFAGWTQKPDSLKELLSAYLSSHRIIHFDYSQFSSIEDCFTALKELSIKPQIIIGWSLGGQIATRLIALKIFTPELLIILAAPFQFVKSEKIVAAMPKVSFDSFRDNFITNSLEVLKKFSLLMMLGDSKRAKELEKNLHLNEKNHNNLVFWLDELGDFSCHSLDLSNFPKTLIIHGEGDAIINVLQAKIFNQKIINSSLKILANCGHCPHISNLSEVQNFLQLHLPKN